MERDRLFEEIKRRLTELYSDRVRGVPLFGSHARGYTREDSDIDLMVLLEGPVESWRGSKAIINAIYPLRLEVLNPIEVLPVDTRIYESGQFAL